MPQKVLVVDDEPSIVRLIEVQLSHEGFEVVSAGDGESALKLLEDGKVDIAILDVLMPGMDGLETMKRLRKMVSIPVILLTARRQDTDKIAGLNMGADDYLAKPFNPEELVARVRAVLRSVDSQPVIAERILQAGDIEIDLERRLVRKNGNAITLSRTEWNLLLQLAENPGKVMLATDLLERVWDTGYREDSQYLRVWISRLRGKLEDDPAKPRLIKTIPRVGYRLDAD